MAEEVQEALDRMVPALNDLQERGVFSKEEIHAIVDRRRDSEYAMRRRQPRKADFLRYLQQEMDLEKLRKLRVKRIRREEKNRGRESDKPDDDQDHERSKHIGDQHIVQHLHVIWNRTIRKFKSDVQLYLQYAEFCKQVHAQRSLSRVYGEALRLHPNQVDLWIEAASHEFFQAGSVQNARVLMQRGLRIHSKAVNLWLQLFSLELHFATKMAGRRKILHGRKDDDDPTTEASHDPLAIAKLVFQNATSQFPHNVNVRVKFWDQCRMFPGTEALKRIIWQSIVTECADNPEAWLAWAIFVMEQGTTAAATKDNGSGGDSDNGGDNSKEDAEEETSTKGEERDESSAQKKRKTEEGTAIAGNYNDETVLSILQKATDKIQTEEMFLKASRMATRYIRELKSNGDKDDTELSAAVDFLYDSLSKASKESFYSADLAMEYAKFFVITGQEEQARKCLRHFIDTSDGAVNAEVWLQLARLSGKDAIDVLDEASNQIPVDQKDHFRVLVCQLGAMMQHGEGINPYPLFERIILLAPGFKANLVFDEVQFGVHGLTDACVQLLMWSKETQGIEGARKVYRTIFYKSTAAADLLAVDEDTCLSLFSECIDTERLVRNEKKGKTNLMRLYDAVIGLLGNSPLADDFLQQKREDLARNNSLPKEVSIPKLDAQSRSFDAKVLSECFEKFRVVHLYNVPRAKAKDTLSWKDLANVFAGLNSEDKNSWCIETDQGTARQELTPEAFLVPKGTQHRAYCSFLVQKDREAYAETESRLPVIELPNVEWSYEPALWMFFGRNPKGNEALPGRREHTDSISCDGTWHFQLSGTKTWTIRPSDDLLQHMAGTLESSEFRRWSTSSKMEIKCQQGDVLIINTRLWFHQTHIPPQPNPSVSYARDFWRKSSSDASATMCNVDGLYATNDIEEGTVIFTEATMRDCSLSRSTEPNCEVVDLEDGVQAVVSTRDIKSGEFFCVAQSDEEGSDDDVEGVEDEEEEDEK